MKLARIRTEKGQIRPAMIDEAGRARDLSAHIRDLGAADLGDDALASLAGISVQSLPVIEGAYAPILDDIRRIFCIGLNYSDHAAEAGMPVPSEPIVFMKVCPATGANDPVVIPRGAAKTDWEVELGVVIGRTAHHIDEADALAHVAGYCIVNDVSEREFQNERGGQWVKGKSCDTFGPIGPWLVTRDEVPNPQDLAMWLDVNGEQRQRGSTKTMVFGVAHLVSYLSRFVTLQPGDVISTGTPPGVALGMKPPQYLKAGDVMTLGIDGLGEQRQDVVAYPE